MSISHVVVLTVTLLASLCLPCVLIRVVRPARRQAPHRVDDGPGDWRWDGPPRDGVDRQMRRAWSRRNRADRPALRRLDRTINQPPYADRVMAERRLPPVEQIAAELRRLDRQRRCGPSTESEKWSAAVATAYDAWLLAACRRLNITEHLTTLAGIDRDIERVRVEGQLQTAGLVLRASPDGR